MNSHQKELKKLSHIILLLASIALIASLSYTAWFIYSAEQTTGVVISVEGNNADFLGKKVGTEFYGRVSYMTSDGTEVDSTANKVFLGIMKEYNVSPDDFPLKIGDQVAIYYHASNPQLAYYTDWLGIIISQDKFFLLAWVGAIFFWFVIATKKIE